MLMGLAGFLVTLFYDGRFPQRLMWTLAMYTMGAVCIARIAIEQDRGYATVYTLALAAAAFLTMWRYVGEPILSGVILAIVGVLADRLVHDCTLIDDAVDSSGHGLIDRLKWPGSGRSQRPSSLPDRSAGAPGDRSGHQPGRTVLYLAAAALPLFGFGQFFLRDDPASWSQAKGALAVYLFASLSLLVVTAFLNLRRYLRRRQAEMGRQTTLAWLAGGIGMIAVVLLFALLAPLPGRTLAALQLPESFSGEDADEDDMEASRWGWGDEAADDASAGDAPGGTRDDGSTGAEPAGTQNRQGAPAGGTEGNRQEGPAGGSESGQSSESDSASPDNAGGPKTDGKAEAGESTSNESTSGESTSRESTSTDGNSEDGASQSSSRDQSNAEPDATSPQSSSPENGDKSESGGGDESGGEGESAGGGESESGSGESGAETSPDDAAAEQADSAGGEAEPPSASGEWFGAAASFLAGAFRWLLFAALLATCLFFAIRYRDSILRWWQDLWPRNPDADPPAPEAVLPSTPGPTQRPFSSFRNPVGKADPSTVVIETFHAMEAWCGERGIQRRPDETPREFVRRVASKFPVVRQPAGHVVDAYNRVVYGQGRAGASDVAAASTLWSSLRR